MSELVGVVDHFELDDYCRYINVKSTHLALRSRAYHFGSLAVGKRVQVDHADSSCLLRIFNLLEAHSMLESVPFIPHYERA